VNMSQGLKQEPKIINFFRNVDLRHHLADVVNSVSTGILSVDRNGLIETANQAIQDITGLQPFEMIGQSCSAVFLKLFEGLPGDSLGNFLSYSGKRVLESELIRVNGHNKHIKLCASPILNRSGDIKGTVISMEDVTSYKIIERRVLRAERIAAMGEITAKMAHEIRNPLGSMELFASSLSKDLEAFGELGEHAAHISKGIDTVNGIISNTLAFVRPRQRPQYRIVDLLDAIDDSLFFSSHQFTDSSACNVSKHFNSERLLVSGDEHLLAQMFLNLILNAVQAMPEGGELSITADATEEIQYGVPQKNRIARIRIADTGEGIPRSHLEKIFDPFFTTKKRGTGLGMSIVHNIVEMHQGTIDMESEVGVGTVSIIMLPLVSEQ